MDDLSSALDGALRQIDQQVGIVLRHTAVTRVKNNGKRGFLIRLIVSLPNSLPANRVFQKLHPMVVQYLTRKGINVAGLYLDAVE